MAVSESGHGVEFLAGDAFYDYILNDLFLPAVADTVITPNTLLERLPRDRERVEGKNVVFPIHIGRNIGVNAIGAGGDLPDPGQQDYNQYRFPVRHVYGRVKFDGITADASNTQMASWLKAIESEVKGLAIDMSRYKQRAYHLEGSGIIGQIHYDLQSNAGGGVTFIEGDTDDALELVDAWPESTENQCPQLKLTKYLRVGQRVALIRTDTGAIASTVPTSVITAVDRTEGAESITLDPAVVTGEANQEYWLVQVSNDDAGVSVLDSAYNVEPMGIAGIVDDGNPNNGNLQNIDATAAANEWHRSTVQTAANDRAVSLALMDNAFTTAMEVGDAAPTALLTSFGVSRAYAMLLLADRQFVGTTEYDGGYKALDYNGVPVIADRDCLNNRIYFLHEPDLRIYVMSDPQWMNKDGAIYHRIDDKDAYQATLYCRETMGTDVRDKHVLLAAILEDSLTP